MQSLYPLSDNDFKDPAKTPVHKLEITIGDGADTVDLCNFYGENYMKEVHYSKGQIEQTYEPIAASIEAIIDNTDGLFHPKNRQSPFYSYLKCGERIIFSAGFRIDGLDYLWQWFEGVISEISYDNIKKQITLRGFDFMQYLFDVKIPSLDNYWGESTLISTVEGQAAYDLPGASNGAYLAYLDGSPQYNEKHWAYDRDTNQIVFLPDYVPTADGVDNLQVYYFTDQIPENVIADLLVMAGRYPTQAAALCAMDYIATGKTISRVWFESGLNILTAIKKICERVDYQFYYKYDNTPVFKPIQDVDRWENRAFTFEKNLISEPEYIENTNEIKNHIIIEGERYSIHDEKYKILSGLDLMDNSVGDRHLKEFIIDQPYEIQELVHLNRDVIVPFYIPASMLDIKYVYFNLYFPGFQQSDYPDGVDEFYLPHYYATCKTFEVENGATGSAGFWVPHRIAGNGIGGGNYYWYRWFFKFDVSPFIGFKFATCQLEWVLSNIAKAGAGANTQIPLRLHGLANYGMLTKADWGMPTDYDFGNINAHDDTLQALYTKDIKTWAQNKLDAGIKALCFRMKGNIEHTDTSNANQYYTDNHQLNIKLEEDTDEEVSIYADNGPGFGASLGAYNSDQEDIDLTAQFSGTGRKRLKFSCNKTRRIDILIRIGLTLSN